ncbi:MAG: type I DNA topoisomerase, partial [Delftia sp.]|nr:type I DNA topoisomerase [Delftia sp.]
AFAHPREIDMPRVDAQQARRILDRLVGYSLSPLLRNKMHRKGLSAGRVQSVTLRLIVEREQEIEAFVPDEYWSLQARLAKQAGDEAQREFVAKLHRVRGQEVGLESAQQVQRILDELETARYVVSKVRRGERRRRPAPPYTTSTMQQEAARRLGFTAKRTMALAQGLYQGIEIDGEPVGLITYMRTDSVNVAQAAQEPARQYIAQHFGEQFLPPEPPRYKTRAKRAQEAHEAIRPTSVLRAPKSLRQYLERAQYQLYTLIWQRFVASQMSPAVYATLSVDIAAGECLFRVSGSLVKFIGFLTVYQEAADEDAPPAQEERALPPLDEGEALDLVQLLPRQHFTQPPPRYTEASL